MDLFALAVANGPKLEQQFAGLRSKLPTPEVEVLARFASYTESEGRVSINLRQTVLIEFLTFGRHLNIHGWAKERARLSGRSAEVLLRERLGAFYERRVAFDNSFDRGHEFHYGTLSTGGLGAKQYGEYSTVFADGGLVERCQVAYLRCDSLQTYVTPELQVDLLTLGGDVASQENRHLLAALKMGRRVCTCPEERWHSMLCSGADYVEAIFVGDATPADLERVRMSRIDYEGFWHFAFESVRNKLSDAERSLVEGFVLLLSLLRQKNIPLEAVDDA